MSETANKSVRGPEAAGSPAPGQTERRSPQVQNEPKSPMPPQHQGKPGLEYELNPRPQYMAPLYKGANKLKGEGRAHIRR